MRSWISAFVLGVAAGAGGMFVSHSYHVVRADDGFHIVPKVKSEFTESYVDIRQFDMEAWGRHHSLGVALVQADKGYLIAESARAGITSAAQSMVESLTGVK